MDCARTSQISPKAPRQCTDTGWLMAFVLFMCGALFLTAFAFTFGDPRRLLHPVDSFGNVCANQNYRVYVEMNESGMDLRTKRYLFPMDHKDPFNSLWICTEQCPSQKIRTRDQLVVLALEQGIHACHYDTPPQHYPNSIDWPSTSIGPCPLLPFPASKVFMSHCVPVNPDGLYDNNSVPILEYMEQIGIVRRLMADLTTAILPIACICVLATALSVVFTLLLYFCSSVVAIFIYVLVIGGSVANCIAVWWTFYSNSVRLASFNRDLYWNGTDHPILIYSAKCNHLLLLFYALISTFLMVLFTATSFISIRKLAFVPELFQRVSRCISDGPKLVLLPVLTFGLLVVLISVWIIDFAFLATADLAIPSNHQANWPYIFNTTFVEYRPLGPVKHFVWYFLLGFLWTIRFVLTSERFVIETSVSEWYFGRSRNQMEIFRSIQAFLCYHLGAVTSGSVLTLFNVPSFMLIWWYRPSDTGPCWGQCRGRGEYTMAALRDDGYCPSARVASDIIRSKGGAGVDVVNAAQTILLLGKCGIVSICSLVGVLILKDNITLYQFTPPLFVSSVLAYFIVCCVFVIYETILDTLFFCYCGKERLKDAGHELASNSALNDFMDRICGVQAGEVLELSSRDLSA